MTIEPLYPTDFDGQFVLSRARARAPVPLAGAKVIQLPTLSLSLGRGLRATRVYDADGAWIGVLLGTPIDMGSRQVVRDRLDAAGVIGGDPDGFVESQIYRLGGSFVFVLDVPSARRIYLDACGSLSVVFDPQSGAAASTAPALLPQEEAAERFEQKLYSQFGVSGIGWFPGPLTAHRGVRRLLANHYLDIDSAQTIRHWPTAAIPVTSDPSDTCQSILDGLRQTISAIASDGPAYQALTAGNETRILLAAAQPVVGDIRFVTVSANGAELDLLRAKELAARFGLDHRVIEPVIASHAQGEDWQARNGQVVAGAHVRTHPTLRALADRPYFVGGFGGEVGRGFLWRATDTDETALTPEMLWTRLGFAANSTGIAAMADWLDGVRGMPTLLQLDLAYIEWRMASWAFGMAYCTPNPTDLHPLISRQSFAAMLSLPPEWRRMSHRTNRMIQTVIRTGWPELLDLPISRFGDYRDRFSLVRRLASDPGNALRRIRKKLL